MFDLSAMSPQTLLRLHAELADQLRSRGITRSSNKPIGDLAELLFCRAFGWTQAGKSNANLDATDVEGKRYQIKARRITRHNGSRQLSAIRDLDGLHFDVLAGVLFTEDYDILRAALIPRSVVEQRASFIKRTNSHRFLLRDDVWEAPGVADVTERLRAVRL